MLNAAKYLFCGIVLSQCTLVNMSAADCPPVEMLPEIMRCFGKKLSPKKLITGWKHGQIKRAYVFEAQKINTDSSVNYILAVCPTDVRTNELYSECFPGVFMGDLNDRDTPYFLFGLQQLPMFEIFSLAFISCAKSSALYPDFLKFFKLEEPSCEDVKKKRPTQYWETVVRHCDNSGKMHHIDDQFIRWQEFNSDQEWVFRFNQGKCTGVMLRWREPRHLDELIFQEKTSEHLDGSIVQEEASEHLDLRELTDKFVWTSSYQVDRFYRKLDGSHGRLEAFNRFKEKYKTVTNILGTSVFYR